MRGKGKKQVITSYALVITMLLSLFMPTSTTLAVNNSNNTINEESTLPNNSNEVIIQILGTSDLHGRFSNYDYASNKKVDGGLNQISTIIKESKKNNPNTLVLDNGDTIQGNYNNLFLNNEWKNPMVLAMNEIGFDVFSLGNHEFNFGMDTLHKIVDEANENLNVLCANFYKDGKRVFNPYIIKEFQGIKVAVIGVVSPHIKKWVMKLLK